MLRGTPFVFSQGGNQNRHLRFLAAGKALGTKMHLCTDPALGPWGCPGFSRPLSLTPALPHKLAGPLTITEEC